MHRTASVLPIALLVCVAQANAAMAQIASADTDSFVRYGATQVAKYRVGVSVEAKRGAVKDVFATVAVPLSCPEQEVELLEEDVTPTVGSLDYRDLQEGGARQMLMRVPQLPSREEAHAILTFQVRTKIILPPEDTSELVIPDKLPRELKRFITNSPYIEAKHSKIRRLAREVLDKLENPAETEEAEAEEDAEASDQSESEDAQQNVETITDWQRVEALYDYVQETITYVEGPDKSALTTLKDGEGDCQNISALFIALCRSQKIPARIVWVHEHNYPEFCLADAEGKLHWFPCESSGMRAFGEMPMARVIMQKGDNFRVPERKKPLRYASDYLIGLPAGPGSGKPGHRFIREQL